MKGKETNRRNIELKLVKLIAKESKIKESKITADGDCSHETMKLKDAYSLAGKL